MENKSQKYKVISEIRNNFTFFKKSDILKLGDENVKKRNVFIKDKRLL